VRQIDQDELISALRTESNEEILEVATKRGISTNRSVTLQLPDKPRDHVVLTASFLVMKTRDTLLKQHFSHTGKEKTSSEMSSFSTLRGDG